MGAVDLEKLTFAITLIMESGSSNSNVIVTHPLHGRDILQTETHERAGDLNKIIKIVII